jgi:Zn-dependent peptidase ImmA (M78 family)
MKDRFELLKNASELRKMLGEDDRSQIDIFRLTQSIDNLTMIFYPMGESISGMCVKGDSNIIIAINSSMSYGRQRFTMAHELYHCYFDEEIDTVVCSKEIDSNNDVEKEANIFASFFLAPPVSLSDEIKKIKPPLDVSAVVKLEQFFGLSRQAMLIRLIDENELSPQKAASMRTNIISTAVSLGYDDTLYRPAPEEKQYVTYGQYIKQAERLKELDMISEGKYEELLLEAFRSDIVYGDDTEGELID